MFQVLTREMLYDMEMISEKQMRNDITSGKMTGWRPVLPKVPPLPSPVLLEAG